MRHWMLVVILIALLCPAVIVYADTDRFDLPLMPPAPTSAPELEAGEQQVETYAPNDMKFQSTSIPCHTVFSGDLVPPAPDGTVWGLAWNWLSSERELLLSAVCDIDDIIVTVGNGDETGDTDNSLRGLTYIYHQGYWNDDAGGGWLQYSLSCSGTDTTKVVGQWCKGSATAPIPSSAKRFVAYTCIWTGSAWQCGCTDEQCSSTFWQLQGVQSPIGILTISTSTNQVWGNGHEEAFITINLTNDSGEGIAGHHIELSAEPPDNVVVTPTDIIGRPLSEAITNNDGQAYFEVSGVTLGMVRLTATSLNESSLSGFTDIEFVQRKVAVFVQGINTELLSPLDEVFPFIRTHLTILGFKRPIRDTPETNCGDGFDDDIDGDGDDGCPLVLNYSYNGGEVKADTWHPNSYSCSDTKQSIATSSLKLRELILDFSRTNPNTRFIIISHSQGGLVAIPTLSLAQRLDITIDAFISLDAALGGAPNLDTFLSGFVTCWGDPAADDMTEIWLSASDHDHQGTTAKFLGQTNAELVAKAQASGVTVVTIGNLDDCVWNHSRCLAGFPGDNTSTQIIDNADIPTLLSLGGNPDLFLSHEIVLIHPEVLDIIQLTVQHPIEQ